MCMLALASHWRRSLIVLNMTKFENTRLWLKIDKRAENGRVNQHLMSHFLPCYQFVTSQPTRTGKKKHVKQNERID